jgi:hypothetical protein
MAELKDTSAAAAEKLSFNHDEHRSDDESPELSALEINYDSNGIRGILNSPYVCGAALLASFGGFSFGYGMSIVMYSRLFF